MNKFNENALYDMDSFEQKPLDFFLNLELERRRESGTLRTLRTVPDGALDLASNDYLGLSRHPEVVEAACEAARNFGAGARASRLVSGQTDLHAELEAELAAFKGCEAALVFSSGYQANLAVVAALSQRLGTSIFCDKRNHASLHDAARLACSAPRYFSSIEKLRRLLLGTRNPKPGILIITDGVFSMDGDVCDLPELLKLAHDFDAYIILDDAHGTGTLGATGRGTTEHFGIHDARIIHVGTLSKALGAQGGFVCGSKVLIDFLVNTARPFIYTTGLNPAAVGAALKALQILGREPERLTRLREVSTLLATGLQKLNFDARLGPSAIIPIVIGDAKRAVETSNKLLERGIWCPAIRPPTVPIGTSRLRLCANAALSDDDIARVLSAFKEVAA